MSHHPSEFARLTPVYATPGSLVPTHYEIEKPIAAISAAGMVEQCPSRIALLHADESDTDAYQQLDVTHSSGARQILGLSQRACVVTSWRTIDGSYDVSWMARGTATGGNGLGFNARDIVRYGTPQAFMRNPTMGGSRRIPYRQGPFWTSEPLHLALGQWHAEAGVRPLEWDPDGQSGELPASDHGGDAGHPVSPWQRRQFGRVRAFLGGGWRHIHELVFWDYHPHGFAPGPQVDPFVGHVVIAPHLIGRMFDRAYWLDIRGEVLTEAPGWTPPAGVEWRRRWEASRRFYSIVADGVRTNYPTPIPSGYAAAVFRRSSDDFTVAFACRLHESDALLRQPTNINMVQGLGVQADPGPNSDENALCELFSKGTIGRAPGWCGLRCFVFTGPFASMQPALRRLYTSGEMDQSTPKGLPVLAGVKPP